MCLTAAGIVFFYLKGHSWIVRSVHFIDLLLFLLRDCCSYALCGSDISNSIGAYWCGVNRNITRSGRVLDIRVPDAF